ncbi:MAG: hypothetical protein MJ252_13280 [archaeon]|nr:hypothetical protein [archaeon]
MSTGNPIKVLKTGTLMKCSKYLANWNERFVVLTNERFLTYDKMDPTADCTLDLFLMDTTNLHLSDAESYEFSFHNGDKDYRFRAPDKETMDQWYSIFETAMEALKKVRALQDTTTENKENNNALLAEENKESNTALLSEENKEAVEVKQENQEEIKD